MTLASLSNLLSVSLQVVVIAMAAALVAAVLRITAPSHPLRFLATRVAALSAAFPWLQTPQRVSTTAPAPSSAAPATVSALEGGQNIGNAAGFDWLLIGTIIVGLGIAAQAPVDGRWRFASCDGCASPASRSRQSEHAELASADRNACRRALRGNRSAAGDLRRLRARWCCCQRASVSSRRRHERP